MQNSKKLEQTTKLCALFRDTMKKLLLLLSVHENKLPIVLGVIVVVDHLNLLWI
jgi:hypothetical protein